MGFLDGFTPIIIRHSLFGTSSGVVSFDLVDVSPKAFLYVQNIHLFMETGSLGVARLNVGYKERLGLLEEFGTISGDTGDVYAGNPFFLSEGMVIRFTATGMSTSDNFIFTLLGMQKNTKTGNFLEGF